MMHIQPVAMLKNGGSCEEAVIAKALAFEREPGHRRNHRGLHLTSFEQFAQTSFYKYAMDGPNGAGV